jgi:hypothetical protein
MTPPASVPPTHAGRILAKLWEFPEGASDAQIAQVMGIRHQTVNAVCRAMAGRDLIEREARDGTILNRALVRELPARPVIPSPDAPWFWEGNVQSTVATFLVEEGWTIVGIVDTASKEPGTDIVAERADIPLWVTVKGFPVGTSKTHPSTQARHGFAAALLDIAFWRQEAPVDVQFAVALPVFPTYQRLADRTRWLQVTVPFDYLWVSEAGDVRRDLGQRPTT